MNSSARTEPPSCVTLSISSHARASISSVSDSMKYEPANGSAVSAAPDSWARTCWVRSAIRAERSVGSASASSKPLVCKDWVPPQTAANPWSATRMMFTSGCWAWRVTPPVWVWKRIVCERGSLEPNRSRTISAHIRRAALLADVVAGNRDRVPARHVLAAVLEDVGGEAHGRLRRVDVVAARDVFLQHVVLDGAAELVGGDALLLADELVEEQQDRGRGVDRHRGRDLVERDR